jgi:hypothetical protein
MTEYAALIIDLCDAIGGKRFADPRERIELLDHARDYLIREARKPRGKTEMQKVFDRIAKYERPALRVIPGGKVDE